MLQGYDQHMKLFNKVVQQIIMEVESTSSSFLRKQLQKSCRVLDRGGRELIQGRLEDDEKSQD